MGPGGVLLVSLEETWEGFERRRGVICPSPQPQHSAADMGLSGRKDGLFQVGRPRGLLLGCCPVSSAPPFAHSF